MKINSWRTTQLASRASIFLLKLGDERDYLQSRKSPAAWRRDARVIN